MLTTIIIPSREWFNSLDLEALAKTLGHFCSTFETHAYVLYADARNKKQSNTAFIDSDLLPYMGGSDGSYKPGRSELSELTYNSVIFVFKSICLTF